MNVLIRGILICTTAASLLCLSLSIWPGRLGQILLEAFFLGVIFGVPIAFAAGAVIGIIAYRWWCRRSRQQFPRCEVLAIPVIAAATVILLFTNVPRRIAFRVSKSVFDAAVSSASTSSNSGRTWRTGR